MTNKNMTQYGVERFESDDEEADLMVEFTITKGEPATWEYPGSDPECELADAYVITKMHTKDVVFIIKLLEDATGLPISEKLAEIILERNT
jgi:hypothetical protein